MQCNELTPFILQKWPPTTTYSVKAVKGRGFESHEIHGYCLFEQNLVVLLTFCLSLCMFTKYPQLYTPSPWLHCLNCHSSVISNHHKLTSLILVICIVDAGVYAGAKCMHNA